MQIAISITHEFGDVTAFATFAEKLKALFAEFAPAVKVAERKPESVISDFAFGPRDAEPRKWNEPPREPPAITPEVEAAFAAYKNPDAVAPPVSADCSASPIADATASEADKPKRGRPRKADKAPEASAPVSLPAAGSFGGPTVASPPATVPAPAANPNPAAAGADDINAQRSFVLEWIGANTDGNGRYMRAIKPYQDPGAGKVRFQDFTAAERAEIITKLKAEDDRSK